MDLSDINQALDALYRRSPHLPRPDGLADTVLAAWNSAGPTTMRDPYGHTDATIAALWSIGAEAGAQRGHAVAATALRDMVGEGLAAEDIPNPDGVELLVLCARVADQLPAAPDTTEVANRAHSRHVWVGTGDDLDVALALGLEKGWLVGHRDATDRLVEHFAVQVTALVGEERLTTTFLNAHLTGQDLVAGICAAAYLAGERDQTTPAPTEGRVGDRGPAAGRAFAPLDQLHPTGQPGPPNQPPPPASPGRTRPGR